MTLDQARQIALTESIQHGGDLAVYRMPRWAPDVYGVRDPAKLPAEAVRVAVYTSTIAAAVKYHPAKAVPTGQGDLFS